MGERGPAKMPDNVLALRGTLQAPRNRLKLPPKAPTAPQWLDREAKAEWNRVVPALDRMGVLAGVDRAILSVYCSAWSRFVALEAQLRKDGMFSSRTDRQARHPLWSSWRETASQLRDLAKELYLQPNSRLRAELPAGYSLPASDDGDDILD